MNERYIDSLSLSLSLSLQDHMALENHPKVIPWERNLIL
jgi:hypothetical protein